MATSSAVLSLAFFQVIWPLANLALVASPMACCSVCLSWASRFSCWARFCRTALSSTYATDSAGLWLKSTTLPLSSG
ncbi:hypothetical protein D3C84_891170 [compost metagenome]